MPDNLSVVDSKPLPDLSVVSSQPLPEPDALQNMLNYRTGNNWVDAPLGVVQGAGKGVASTASSLLDLASKGSGRPDPLDPGYETSITQPSGIGQGTGKFLEQAGEFLIPDTEVGKLVEGAPVLVRAGAKALTGSAVAGAQNKGDPDAMATAALLGGGSELVGSGVQAVQKLGATKAPTPDNYWDSFAATSGQRPTILKAIGKLRDDGILPGESPADMQTAVKSQLGVLSGQYQALDPGIMARTTDVDSVIAALRKTEAGYMQDGVVSSTNKPYVDAIEKQIQDVKNLAAKNAVPAPGAPANGPATEWQLFSPDNAPSAPAGSDKLTFAQLRYLRDGVNGRTNWTSPDVEQSLYKNLGDVYRSSMDKIAPETTQLNRDWSTYRQLEDIADENVSKGRGTTPGAVETAVQKASDRQTGAVMGAGAGATIGHATGIPGASYALGGLGGMFGAAAWPKISAPVVQTLKNAVDNGALNGLNPAKMQLLRFALSAGDNRTILALLGKSAGTEIATKTAAQ